MERITKKDLEYLVKRINEVKGAPVEEYTKDPETGRYTSNPGNYHLDWAYGGVCLEQTVTGGGGTKSIIPGYGTKRELYGKMQAFLIGAR